MTAPPKKKDGEIIFLAEIVQAYNFKILVELLQSNLKMVNFYVHPNKITLRESDEKHEYLGDLNLSTELFKFKLNLDLVDPEKKECKYFKIGVNIGHVHLVTKTIKKKDVLTLFVTTDSRKELFFKIENKPKEKCSIKRVRIINVKERKWELPKYDSLPNAIMNSSEFQKVGKNMSAITKTIHVSIQSEGIKFSADSDSIVPTDDFAGTWIEDAEIIHKDIFSKQKFAQLAKHSGLSSDNQMRFYAKKSLNPIRIATKVGSMGDYSSYVMADVEEEDNENGEDPESDEDTEENKEDTEDSNTEELETPDAEENKEDKEITEKPKKKKIIIIR